MTSSFPPIVLSIQFQISRNHNSLKKATWNKFAPRTSLHHATKDELKRHMNKVNMDLATLSPGKQPIDAKWVYNSDAVRNGIKRESLLRVTQ